MASEETAEDRVARLEAEATFAQEAAKLREEAARAKVLEKHTREQELVCINAPKVHNEWRQKMRAAKLEELKAEVKIMMENQEHAVECRDSIIQSLDQELEEAEEQHVRAYHGHMRCMDVLLQLDAARSTFILQQFDSNVKALQRDYGQQKQEIRTSFRAAKADMEAMIAAGREHFDTSGAAAQLAFETAKAEAQEGDSEEFNVLKLSLEAQVSEVRKLLHDAQQAHHRDTHAKAQAFKELSQSDAETTAVLAAKSEIHRELADALSHWRSRALATARDWSSQVAGLSAERARLQGHHSTMKASLQRFRADQNARLKLLCKESAVMEAKLKDRLALGNSILQLIALCKRRQAQSKEDGYAGLPISLLQSLRNYSPLLLPPRQKPTTVSLSNNNCKSPDKAFGESSREASRMADKLVDVEWGENSWKIRAGLTIEEVATGNDELVMITENKNPSQSTDMAMTIKPHILVKRFSQQA